MPLVIILIIIGIALLFTGIFVQAVKFLLWIGLVILIVGVIAWLMRYIKSKA
ncbi:hypothetical protein [uncultured Microbacterium sp.]|uniref:hypothetical protein n=1 Tax=uncultured Microbacterium sp. TaxID=191216 RepID=UPI0025E47A32|nr:hypothetical protein [uncultured Microbacterium sp.]